MMNPSRRAVLKGSLIMGAAVTMPAALRAATGAAPALFVYDARFAASREMAEAWRARGVSVLDPREHDLGVAWRGHIPALIAANARMEGVTLWSDRFVCETFAAQYAMRSDGEGRALEGVAGGSLRHWCLA